MRTTVKLLEVAAGIAAAILLGSTLPEQIGIGCALYCLMPWTVR